MSAPASADAYCDAWFRNGDRLKLYARDYSPTGPLVPPGKLPVICLHGLTRNCRDFEELAPRIAAMGRRVIVMDMRGRGRSDFDPLPARYVPPTYAGDVVGWMDHLKIPAAVFVGTSMGGIITMILSALAPGRVAAAVLNDVGPRLEKAALDRIAAYVGKPVPDVADWTKAAKYARLANEMAFPDHSEEFWDVFARRLYAERDGVIALDYDPAIAKPFAVGFAKPAAEAPPVDMTPFFDAVAKKPLLAVRGALSDLLSADGLQYMQGRAPKMRSVTLPGIGHAPFLTEPVAWDALAAFLAEIP